MIYLHLNPRLKPGILKLALAWVNRTYGSLLELYLEGSPILHKEIHLLLGALVASSHHWKHV